MIYLWTIYYWILDKWWNDNEMFFIEFLTNVVTTMKCWSSSWLMLKQLWKCKCYEMTCWGGYIIVLQWIINQLSDVNWAVMKLGCWRMSSRLWNVDCDCWLASTNDIQNEWSGSDCWLALANGIRDGWSGYDCWLALANDIRDGWPNCTWWVACDCWLASANGIRDGWLNHAWWLALANSIRDGWWSSCGWWLILVNGIVGEWMSLNVVINYD